jgi:hypothetical protein
MKKTPNAQRPTPNLEWTPPDFGIGRSALGVGRFLVRFE